MIFPLYMHAYNIVSQQSTMIFVLVHKISTYVVDYLHVECQILHLSLNIHDHSG